MTAAWRKRQSGPPARRSGKTEVIIDTDRQDQAHHSNKKPVHRGGGNPPVDTAPGNPAQHAAHGHAEQRGQREGRDASGEHRQQQAADLGDQDDVQGVLGSGFRVHGEEIEKNHQIDRAAANPQKRGGRPQEKADQNTDHAAMEISGGNALLVQGVKQGAQCDDEQADRLNGAHRLRGGKQLGNLGEELLAQKPAQGGAHGQKRGAPPVHGAIGIPESFQNRVAGHGEHGAAREEIDRTHTVDAQRIQNRLDDNTAADPTDGSRSAMRWL